MAGQSAGELVAALGERQAGHLFLGDVGVSSASTGQKETARAEESRHGCRRGAFADSSKLDPDSTISPPSFPPPTFAPPPPVLPAALAAARVTSIPPWHMSTTSWYRASVAAIRTVLRGAVHSVPVYLLAASLLAALADPGRALGSGGTGRTVESSRRRGSMVEEVEAEVPAEEEGTVPAEVLILLFFRFRFRFFFKNS